MKLVIVETPISFQSSKSNLLNSDLPETVRHHLLLNRFNQASSTYSILTAAFGEPGVARLPRAVLQNLKNRKNFYKISVHILYNQILKITKNHQNILVKSIGYKDNFSIMSKLQNLPRFLDFLRFCSFNIIFPFFLQIFCLWK